MKDRMLIGLLKAEKEKAKDSITECSYVNDNKLQAIKESEGIEESMTVCYDNRRMIDLSEIKIQLIDMLIDNDNRMQDTK